MALTEKDMQKIAKLARIEVPAEQIGHFSQELSQILHMMQQLQEVNTDNVPQMTSVAKQALPMREDKITDGGYPEDVLKNAPAAEYGCFVVPKVIE